MFSDMDIHHLCVML